MLRTIVSSIATVALLASAAAAEQRTYEVRVTNVTRNQSFTPILAVAHDPAVRLFELGAPAGSELAFLAEAGGTAPLAAAPASQAPLTVPVVERPGLLLPGESAILTVVSGRGHTHLSVAAMLIPTNDTFFAVNGLRLPTALRAVEVVDSPGYDAGSEPNDQNCARIPGPRCNGEGASAPTASDEGYVYIGNGFHELGTDDGQGNEVRGPLTYDSRNPVARIEIRRVVR
ncbi:MAG: hypothetical protein FJ148_23795 [Deltaproteobacteria bacterium]|nr:hypothetical protein [Deltaproteobacteria bacterium]